MKYYIIAGEASGDLHASNLMREIKLLDQGALFRCWGGDLMQAQGAEIVKHIRDISYMGFVEVLANLRTITGNIKFCKQDILNFKPDVLILVDYPGFNLRIAEFAKQNGLRVFYYISPQVWAWKQGRVKKIKKIVERMYVILPFEKDFYKRFDYDVDFVGHPLLDAIEQFQKNKSSEIFLKKENPEEKPVIALLPGSRKQEIALMLKTMLQVVPSFPAYHFVVGATPNVSVDFYKAIIGNADVSVVLGRTYELLANSVAALVTSGTATLETALFSVPEAVCYKGSGISYQIAKRVIKVKYISLVNLILDRPAVKELIQNDFKPENLINELKLILDDAEYKQKMLTSFAELQNILGGAGASRTAARLMVNRMVKNNPDTQT
jgi:lipid-A-disaccharide synthase